jgi:hypothetical protein
MCPTGQNERIRCVKGYLLAILGTIVLASCTTLPRPHGDAAAEALLNESSQVAGHPWQRLNTVSVAYEGNWSSIAKTTQPVLVDANYRQISQEVYTPGKQQVLQIHRGPSGEKRVLRTRSDITVWRNGKADPSSESSEVAALVADAYIVFTFGSSVLRERGSSWQILGQRKLAGESCTLLAGTMRPGFGMSPADGVIAWIGNRTKRLHRIQLTLNGLASTAGADVDVTFGDFRAGPHGTEWQHHFIERVRRPINAKAHEWRLTKLDLTL